MKIAIIHQKYNAFGGGARVLSDIINFYAKDLQNEVTIIVRHWEGDLQLNVKIVKLDGFYLGAILRDALFARSVKKYLENNTFDVVISDQKIDGIDIYIAGGGVHKTYLQQRRTTGSILSNFGTYLRFFNYYTLYSEYKLFHSSKLKKVICVSNLVRIDILTNYNIDANKLVVVYNGIDAKNFARNYDTRVKLRRELSIGDSFTLIFVGSGYLRKGLSQVITALQFLPDVKLIILGKDNDIKHYQEYAKKISVDNQCNFLGAKPQITDYYSASDAFILPSSYEPFGLVYLEALANGIPVIVSDKAGASELINDHGIGYVVKHNSVEDIVNKIILLQSNHYDIEECLKLANEFTIDVMINNMNVAIKTVLNP